MISNINNLYFTIYMLIHATEFFIIKLPNSIHKLVKNDFYTQMLMRLH